MTSLNDEPGLYNSGHVKITNEFYFERLWESSVYNKGHHKHNNYANSIYLFNNGNDRCSYSLGTWRIVPTLQETKFIVSVPAMILLSLLILFYFCYRQAGIRTKFVDFFLTSTRGLMQHNIHWFSIVLILNTFIFSLLHLLWKMLAYSWNFTNLASNKYSHI